MATVTTTMYSEQQSTILMSNTNFVRRSELTQLVKALNEGDYNQVNTILTRRQIGKERSRIGRTALHYIAENGNTDCLELLTSLGDFDLNATDHEGHTGLHLAVINGNRDSAQILINAKANINCLDHEKHSLVHWATVCGESEILALLLLNGANASTIDIHSATPLHYAAQMCGHLKRSSSPGDKSENNSSVSKSRALIILRQLIQHGVNVRVQDQDGREPLLWAASAGSSEAILALVNAGASVDAEDKDGLTALHCAASRGHTDCLETLIGLCGCNVDLIDHNGCTALFYAVTLGHPDCTELLLNYGAEPNRQDRKGRTPAHCASSKGQLETIKQIHKHGANLWMRNVRGELPLHEAILSRRKELVVWLLNQRPEAVNATNNDGRTCLHLAALSNNVQMVKILLDHNADVNAVMRNGKGNCMTPLDAALHRGNSAVAKFLQIHGGVAFNSLNDPKFMMTHRMMMSQSRSNIDSRLSNNMINNSRLSYNNMTNIQCNTPDNHVVLTPDYIISSTPIQQYYQHDTPDQHTKKLMMMMDGETPIPANEGHINRTDESEGFHMDSSDDQNLTEVEREIIRRAQEEEEEDMMDVKGPDENIVTAIQQQQHQQQRAQLQHRHQQMQTTLRELRSEEQQTEDQDMNESYIEVINRKKVVRIMNTEGSQTDFSEDYRRRMSRHDNSHDKSFSSDNTESKTTATTSSSSGTEHDKSLDEGKGQTETDQDTDQKGMSVDESDTGDGRNKQLDVSETEETATEQTEDSDARGYSKEEEEEETDGDHNRDGYAQRQHEEEETEETEETSQTAEEETEVENNVTQIHRSEVDMSPEELMEKNRPDDIESTLLESTRRSRYMKNKKIQSARHNKSGGKQAKKMRKSKSIETKTVGHDVEYVKRERTVRQAKSMSPIGRAQKKRHEAGCKSVSPSMMNCDDGYISSRSVSIDIGSAGSSKAPSVAGSDDEAEVEKKARKQSRKSNQASPTKDQRSTSRQSDQERKSGRSSRKSVPKSRTGSRKSVEFEDEIIQRSESRKSEHSPSGSREQGEEERSSSRKSQKSRPTSRKSYDGEHSSPTNHGRGPISSRPGSTKSTKSRPQSHKSDINRSQDDLVSASTTLVHPPTSPQDLENTTIPDHNADLSITASINESITFVTSIVTTSKAPHPISSTAAGIQTSPQASTEATSGEEKTKPKKKSPPSRIARISSKKRKSEQSDGGSVSGGGSGSGSDAKTTSSGTLKGKKPTKIPRSKSKTPHTRSSGKSDANSATDRNSMEDEIELGSKIDLKDAVKNRKLKTSQRSSDDRDSNASKVRKQSKEYRYDGRVPTSRKSKLGRKPSKSPNRVAAVAAGKDRERSQMTSSEERELQIQNKIMAGKKQAILYEMNKVDKLDKQIYSRSTSRMNESGSTSYGRVTEGKKGTDVDTPVSVTQAIQVSMRKYALERHIFSQLLELKRLDSENTSRTTEQIIVKRLVEASRRAGLHHHFRDFDASFTFRNYEKYLHDNLRLLQAGNKKLLPRFAPSDDIDRLATALKSFNRTSFPYIHNAENENALECCHTTHKCHHAAHAYTGVPCAAYIPPGKYGGKRGKPAATTRLPRVNPVKAPGPIQKDADEPSPPPPPPKEMIDDLPSAPSPITLHLQQGDRKSVFQLPNDTELDPSKNYYVSLSIKPTSTSPRGNMPEDNVSLNQSV